MTALLVSAMAAWRPGARSVSHTDRFHAAASWSGPCYRSWTVWAAVSGSGTEHQHFSNGSVSGLRGLRGLRTSLSLP